MMLRAELPVQRKRILITLSDMAGTSLAGDTSTGEHASAA
jgi:hypothetical protein